MTAAFFLGQDVDLTGELGVRMDGTGLGQNLTSFDGLLVNAAEQSADVVAGFGVSSGIPTESGIFPPNSSIWRT